MPRYKQEGIETTRIGVVLPTEIKQRLKDVADKKAWSISQTAAIAIEEWLDRHETPDVDTKEDAA